MGGGGLRARRVSGWKSASVNPSVSDGLAGSRRADRRLSIHINQSTPGHVVAPRVAATRRASAPARRSRAVHASPCTTPCTTPGAPPFAPPQA
eukprot:scaffold11554_cov98-Isochrysis_galbana.AAC.5